MQLGNLLSQKPVLVVERTIREPQRGYCAGHTLQRELAGSTALAELHELLLHARDAAVDGAPLGMPRRIIAV